MTLAKRAPHYSNSLSLRHSVFTLIAVAVLSANAKADEQKTKETEPELSPKEKEASRSTAPSAQSKKPRENYEPPRLKTRTLPLVPRRILDGEAGAVVLRLTIETNGAVGLAELHTPLLPDLDEFALEQAPLLKFAPAKVRGVPRRSIILFEWPFHETTPEPESSSPTNEATIHRKARVKTSSKRPRSRPSSRTHRAADADAELEVTVRGRSKVERLKRSPHAVDVLEMQTAQREAGDLGDRLNRSGAAIVRRSGGLGSRSALALNGLGGDRVRLFIDGVELKYAGYPFGAANVPVNLVDRIEIYQGVVPVNFGTDALGGVVHLVTSENVRDDRAMASLQIGSFDTIRASLSAQSYLPRAKSYARLNAFLDSSDNDYPIDVEVVDARGRLSPATVRRFHDSYRSIGGSFTVGTLSQPWANHAAITGFVNAHERDIQSDPTMSVPYGEVTFKKSGGGAHLRHTKRVGSRAQFETILGYSFTRTQFTDVATCRYGWRGDCLIDTGIAGEANQIPVDRTAQDHVAFAKLGARLQTKAGDRLNLSIAPTVAERRGDDAELSGEEYDPLRDPQSLQSGILGIEWVSDWLDDRLTTVIFAKSYGQHAYGKQANATAEVETLENSTFRVGAGASLRLFLTDTLFAKASYEHATRLPDPDEYFGDAGLIVRNLELVPETSHNGNLSLHAETPDDTYGVFSISVDGGLRSSRDLITLLNSANYLKYENLNKTSAWSIKTALGWQAPKYFSIQVQGSYIDQRNRTDAGFRAEFIGDRIPNQPYLQGSSELKLTVPKIVHANDRAELTFRSRYVHEFARGWESAGSSNPLKIDSQLTHGLALSHISQLGERSLATSVEAHNLSDEKVADFYGVQRPGRSFHFKTTLAL